MKTQSYLISPKCILLVTLLLCCSAFRAMADIQAPNPPLSPVKDNTSQPCGVVRYYYTLASIPVTPLNVDSIPDPAMLVKWYIQATETGTDESNPIDSTHLDFLLAPGTYYIRARFAGKPLWSYRTELVVPPVSGSLGIPGNLVNGADIYGGTDEYTAVPGANGNSLRWYTSPLSGVLLHTGLSFTPQVPYRPYYYVATYNTTTGCESSRILVASEIFSRRVVNTVMQAGVLTKDDLLTLTPTALNKEKMYYDGLGRPLQQVLMSQSPTQKDIITPYLYDGYGNTPRVYLPYSKTSQGKFDGATFGNQDYFYTSAARVAHSRYPYSETKTEASPLNRVIEQSAPGDDWKMNAGHTQKISHQLNAASELRLFKRGSPGEWHANSSFYPYASLNVEERTDEQGHKTRVYTDFSGRMVGTRQMGPGDWITTCYVYDEWGRLVFVVPQMALYEMEDNSDYTLTEEIIARWVYAYTYDAMGRMITKKIPGKGLESTIYNAKDQVIMQQDANMEEQGSYWLYYKYDVLGRLILTGFLSDAQARLSTVTASRGDLQQGVDALEPELFERRYSINRNALGYTNRAFPEHSELDVVSAFYYDDYLVDSRETPHAMSGYYATGQSPLINGKMVRSKSKTVTGFNTLAADFLNAYTFYDDEGRVAQSYTQLPTYTNDVKTEITDYEYNFLGNITRSRTDLQDAGSASEVYWEKQTLYDHAGRVSSVIHTTNAMAPKIIAQNAYNELGQRIEKNLEVTGTSTCLQSVDYTYNIRGWLTHINDPDQMQGSPLGIPCEDAIADKAAGGFGIEGIEGHHVTEIADSAMTYMMAYLEELSLTEDQYRMLVDSIPGEGVGSTHRQKLAYKVRKMYLDALYLLPLINETTILASLHDVTRNFITLRVGPIFLSEYAYNNDANDLFGLNLGYNEGNSMLAAPAQYNGNISYAKWRTKSGDEEKHMYGFQYDTLNRLTAAKHATLEFCGWTLPGKFDVSDITYYDDGSILTMKQRGATGLSGSTYTYGLMDDLRYDYDGGRLISVQDLGVTHASVRNDFSEGSTGMPSPLYPEYLYDANGNMIEDKNKAIVITYNFLNLPSKVEYEDGRSIEYVYDAGGAKRRMIVKDPSVSLETNTDYLNAVVYEDGVIDYLMMDEGQVKNESGEYRYHYYLQDHLGNTRAVFKNDGGNVATLIQANSYYPFGLEMPELSYVGGSGETKYKYNGKEMQDAFSLNWIDYGARFYDPQIGRWHTLDPMAEARHYMTPYQYVSNNPILRVDPTGMLDGDYYDKDGTYLGNDGIDDDKVYQLGDAYRAKFENKDVNWGGTLDVKHYTELQSKSNDLGKITEFKMTFTGKANSKNPKQADGQLNFIQVAGGKEFTRASFDAVGGPWGNGSPENGKYLVNNLLDRGPNSNWPNEGMTKEGVGYSLNVNPEFKTGRSELRIHPDGGKYFGTQGCIGLTNGKGSLVEFKGLAQDALSKQKNISLNIDIKNNPNNNGYGKKIKSNGE